MIARVRLNIWDVGGQATLRPYWQNYYERTDALLWVVDAADVERLRICKTELHQLLKEEKLAGATLLILANKQDLPGALSATEIKQASLACTDRESHLLSLKKYRKCNSTRLTFNTLRCKSWGSEPSRNVRHFLNEAAKVAYQLRSVAALERQPSCFLPLDLLPQSKVFML